MIVVSQKEKIEEGHITPICCTKAQGILKLDVGLCASAVLLYIAREKLSLCRYGDFSEDKQILSLKLEIILVWLAGSYSLKILSFVYQKTLSSIW